MNLVDVYNRYTPISLSEMDGYEFMNRIDTKFVFPTNKLPKLLARISRDYKILEINNHRDFPYTSSYLDTSNYLFFYQHMSGRSMRVKVRYRTYEATGVSYLEVKQKTKKMRTVKWRIKNVLNGGVPDSDAVNFLSKYIDDTASKINPVLISRFHRITLVGINTKERITFDHNISFNDNSDAVVELPYLSIAELKREGYSRNSPFLLAVKEMMIRKSGFSKYCMGSALLRSMPKINIIKPQMLLLQKIENENVILSA